jgi:guanylate kinase
VPNLIVVSAPSGAGKSTVLLKVLEAMGSVRFSVSHTTRAPRPGEREGIQYHFVSEEEFGRLQGAGMFLEWAEVHGRRYGTSRSEYERAERDGVDLLLDLDVQGAAQVRLKFPDAVTVFVLPPSYEDLERRLRGRAQDDEESVRRRLETAREELGLYREYDYAIVNEDLDECVLALKSIIRAARCRTSRMDDAAARILRTFD